MSRLSSKSSVAVSALIEAIENKALPLVEKNADDCPIIPRSSYDEMRKQSLPEGATISSCPIKGRRKKVRERPDGFQFVSARWPDEALEAKHVPMIACVIKGAVELRLNNYLLSCREGHMVFIPAGFAHPNGTRAHFESKLETGRSGDILWFCPMAEILKCWMCRSENGKHSSLPSVYLQQKTLCAYYNSLFEDLDDHSDLRRKIRRGLLMVLLASVQNEIEEGNYFRWLPQVVALSSEDEADPIKSAQNYIRRHMGEALTIENVARHFYMSRSQFARKFREGTGETVIDFLTRCRLEEAKMRLKTTDAQIAGVSRHVGLKPRHFNQLFQRNTGLTPGEYRRRHHVRSQD